MEEVRENPRLAGRVELCEEILHFCRGVELRVMALTPEAGENTSTNF